MTTQELVEEIKKFIKKLINRTMQAKNKKLKSIIWQNAQWKHKVIKLINNIKTLIKTIKYKEL